MTCDQRGHDAVSAVPDVQDLAGTRQAHRRRLATLLEPRAVQLDLRPVEAATTEANVCERDPCRCERRCMCDSPPFSRSSRMRTGGVEPPQPGATRLQRAELAGARRPQKAKQLRRRGLTRSGGLRDLPRRRWDPAGGLRSCAPSLAETEAVAAAKPDAKRRPSGICPAEGGDPAGGFRSCGTRPCGKNRAAGRARTDTCGDHDPGCSPLHHGRQERKWKAGSAPRNRRQRRYRPLCSGASCYLSAAPASAIPRCHLLTGWPWRLVGASCTLGPALCTALVPSLPGPPVGGPFLSMARVGFEPTVSSS